MAKKRRYNLDSPNGIGRACPVENLTTWFTEETEAIDDLVVRRVVSDVAMHLGSFVAWPAKAMLLWRGCDRSQKYHTYPEVIKKLAFVAQIGGLDTRVNGPAVAAFRIAGGNRPPRFGSRNAWSIHHLYSGKFPYLGKETTLHASKDGLHFTQSAGLVAIHPIADQMCDEFPAFAWFLRALSFQRFGYDPDGAFSDERHDDFGFTGRACTTVPINGQEIATVG